MSLEVRLRTDAATMHSTHDLPTNPNAVVGHLYFDFQDGGGFPSVGWEDRLLSVVGWWIYPMKELFLEQTIEARLLFGETSRGVVVRRLSTESLRLSFVRDVMGDNGEELRVEDVTVHSFLESLERVAAELDAELAKRRWPLSAHSADIRRLRLLF